MVYLLFHQPPNIKGCFQNATFKLFSTFFPGVTRAVCLPCKVCESEGGEVVRKVDICLSLLFLKKKDLFLCFKKIHFHECLDAICARRVAAELIWRLE